jgi:Cof subfamily protein (haloacid dehalogenase superfamily)
LLKLIATDMDGTLLNEKKELPEKTFEMIERLHEKGITFAVASGRQYLSLQRLCDEMKDDIVIIAENGGIILDRGKVIFADVMKPENIIEIVEAVSKIPGLKMTICGLKSAYMFEDNIISELPMALVDSYFPIRTIIKSLDDLPIDEEVVKFAVFDVRSNASKNIYEKLKHLEHKYQFAVSGAEWTDIMNVGINKGVAIQKLQEKLGATREETMVFGDALNDYEMMQQAYYSYAVANAMPEIKAIANFKTLSNEEQGVLKILEELVTTHV